MKDLYNNIEVRRVLSPLAAAITDNTNQVGQTIDMRGFKSLVFVMITGTLADAGGAAFVPLIEHSDAANMAGAVDVPDSQLDPTEAIAGFDEGDDDDVRKIGYVGEKRYVRLTLDITNNSAAAPLAIIAILSNPSQLATTAQAT